MNPSRIAAALLSFFVLGACADSTPLSSQSSQAPHEIYYATAEVAAKTSPENIHYTEPSGATPTSEMKPFVIEDGAFTPYVEPVPGGGTPPSCHLCVYQDVCGPICCIGQPHCQIYAR